jgi:aspartyl-tRNA(Asn)/glutamyl-tRNA(Gln) amidotransferase subunit B
MAKIGLEIHGYIETKEKLFCDCPSDHGKKDARPNTNICPVCTGQPGSKPLMPNYEAIKKAVQIALLLKCKINEKMPWQRKHYSWPDLPKGFQSTFSGSHAIPNGENGEFMGIKIRECHLEEDPAAWNPDTGEVDYNRSGSPLIEIVTEPDFKESEEVAQWVKNLIVALSYIKAIDKKSGIKADVNVSIPGGKRVEMKNINSVKKIKEAIDIEIERQKKEVPEIEETRMYDERSKTTKIMRTKEGAQDYRFITDPDLPVVSLSKEEILKIKDSIPETPQEKLQKLIRIHEIDKKTAEILTKKIEIVEFFEEVTKKIPAEFALPWVTVELLGTLNYNKKELDDVEIEPEHFIELLKAVRERKITELRAKDILRSWIPKSYSPQKEIRKSSKIEDKDEILTLAKKVIIENKKAVEDFRQGDNNTMNFLIGQVMKLSNKRADYKTAKETLEKLMR